MIKILAYYCCVICIDLLHDMYNQRKLKGSKHYRIAGFLDLVYNKTNKSPPYSGGYARARFHYLACL